MNANPKMAIWVCTCPHCGPVRIESVVKPERCNNTKTTRGRVVRCRENLTSAQRGRIGK